METVKQTFSVANLYLNASADTIHQHLINTKGIVTVTVTLSDRNVTVEYDPTIITADIIIEKIKACGYHAYTFNRTQKIQKSQIIVSYLSLCLK